MRIRRTNAEWRALYLQFLKSREWDAMRGAVLVRADYICEACLRVRAAEVHHVVYPQRKDGALTIEDFQKQPLWQLRAVCRPCHDTLTEMQR